ncbi:MAG: nucleotidyltransferase family protein [Actinomycetota bacterium]|nr:nucleotidyltransferase family protein [Actinomycetota bacterium]
MPRPIVGVVLAAGASTRMAASKLTLEYQGTTVLNATIDAVQASMLDRVIVVTGCDAEMVEASIKAVSVTVVTNPDYRRGNMSSLLTATTADPDAAAFLLVAGDLPQVRTTVINTMVGVWTEERPWAAVAAYRDRVAHPFLLSRDAVECAASMVGEKVLWRLLVDAQDDRVVKVAVAQSAPRDINTPRDYEELQSE